MDTNNTQTLDTKFSAIDKALAAAKARKAAKEGLQMDGAAPAEKQVRIKQTDEEKARKSAERAAQQAELKSQREARKAAKAAEKSTGKPAHMKKIERAAGKLPELTEQTQLLFNEATTNFSAGQLTALALHLQYFNRVKATERALGQKIESGQQVRIIGGDPKFVGQVGTVTKAQRIRCYVQVPGFKREAYCFTSDVEIVAASSQATGTDG